MDARWFAIWTRSRHEKLVRDQLEKKKLEVFLPTIGRWSRWKDRKKKIDWPLFPGYCFTRAQADDRLAILKGLPITPVAAAIGQTLTPVLIATLFQCGVLAFAATARSLLPHEFVHSWNGKYRRPAGLATGD